MCDNKRKCTCTWSFFWTDPKNLGGPIDLLSYVRQSVRMYSTGTAPYFFLIFGIKIALYGIMSTMKPDFREKKMFLAKNGEKGVKNMCF